MKSFEEKIVELMNLSDDIKDYIINQKFVDGETPVDALTETSILNKCYEILMDSLNEQGIIFHVDKESILEDGHNTRTLITLFNVCTFAGLYNQLVVNKDLISDISSIYENFSNNEYITEVMRLLKDNTDNQDYTDMYVFLFDKISSDDNYSLILESLLDTFKDKENRIDSIDGEDIGGYLSVLKEERLNLDRKISDLLHSTMFSIPVLDDVVKRKDKLLTELLFPCYYASFIAKHLLAIGNNESIHNEEIDNEFKTSLDAVSKQSKRYIKYFTIRESTGSNYEIPTTADYILMILTAIGVNNIFGGMIVNVENILDSIHDEKEKEIISNVYQTIKD